MQRRTIPAIIVVASILHIGSAYAQHCYDPDLGAGGPEICFMTGNMWPPIVIRGPSPLVIPPGLVVGDFIIDDMMLVLIETPGGPFEGASLQLGVVGTVTKMWGGSHSSYIVINAHAGLSGVEMDEGYAELALIGEATGPSEISLSGGAGYRALGLGGVGEPAIRPFAEFITAAVPFGGVFGDAMVVGPVDAGAISVFLGLTITIQNVGDSVEVPALVGAGPNGLASLGPLGREDGYLLLPVPWPDGPVEYFSLDQFFLGCPSCSGEHYHSAGAFVESIRGSQLTDPAPVNCGFGLVSELIVKDVDLVAEDTTLDEDLHVPEGYDLVIVPLATLTIPEGRAAFVSGEVVVLGRLVVEGELLNADGGTLINSGNLDVDGLILNNPEAVISNDPGATITNTGNTIANYGTIDNRGTIDNTGRITNGLGGTFTGDGTVTGNTIVEIEDSDEDGVPDSFDNCVDTPNADQADADGDGTGDACEAQDRDGDGVADAVDNCPDVANTDQTDDDGDGVGDVCDPCPVAAILLLTLTIVGLVRSRKR